MKIAKLNEHATRVITRMLDALPENGQVYISTPLESLYLKLINDAITDHKGVGRLYNLTIQPAHGTNLIHKEIMVLYVKFPKNKGLLNIYPSMRVDTLANCSNESIEIRNNHVECFSTTILKEHCEIVDRWLSVHLVDTPIYKG